jgi:hypothetical protein
MMRILARCGALAMALGMLSLTAEAQQAASGAAEAPPAEGDGANFNRELLTVEEQVHQLKEQVFRTKATLQLLREIVVQGSNAGSRATVWHVNQLGKGYKVEAISYYLDGQGKFSKSDPSGALNDMKEAKVFEGALPPGSHDIQVVLKMTGTGYGLFSYVKDYTFNVQSTSSFTAEEGKRCTVRVILDERKGVGVSFTERPNIKFETQCSRDESGAGGQ